jgi:MarR family transcriptional regulator, organic hydroperoxide resistance regulator
MKPKRPDRALTALAEEIDQHLRVMRQLLRRPVEAEFARGNLTAPQRTVMQFVVHFNGRSLKELSKDVGLSHSTVSGIVDRLEKRGMVERHVDKKDRRISRILPSKRVRNYVRNTLPEVELNPLVRALEPATSSDRAAVLAGVRILRRLVETGSLPQA